MRVVSLLHPRNGTNGADVSVNESGEVLVLKYQGEAILSEVPETFVVRCPLLCFQNKRARIDYLRLIGFRRDLP